ncbi:hypothetical protein [Vibrio phage RYC]|nr:hypothetical protein [Vibrio phage RYC]
MSNYQRPEFTVKEGLDIQAAQITKWSYKLNKKCLEALQEEVRKQNTVREMETGYDVWRGAAIDSFIATWHPYELSPVEEVKEEGKYLCKVCETDRVKKKGATCRDCNILIIAHSADCEEG